MKELKVHLYESIFNREKNITNPLDRVIFNDPHSDFWKYVMPVTMLRKNKFYSAEDIEEMEKSIDVDNKIIDLPNVNIQLNTSLKNPFRDKYTLWCHEFFIGGFNSEGPHPGPVVNGGGFKEIHTTSAVQIDGYCERLDGFHFVIDADKHSLNVKNKVVINWADKLESIKSDFTFTKNDYSILSLRNITMGFPNFKGVTSNAEYINIYSSNIFEIGGIKKVFDEFFGGGTITANGIVKKKTLRNIVAIANNKGKYNAIIPSEVIPVGSLNDLLDVSGFYNLKKVVIRSNNVGFSFVRPSDDYAIRTHANFVKFNSNNPNQYNGRTEELIDEVRKCQTKDGWVLMIEPE